MSETGRPDPAKEATQQTTQREHLDELLDEALDETFPASDPIAVHEQVRKDSPPR